MERDDQAEIGVELVEAQSATADLDESAVEKKTRRRKLLRISIGIACIVLAVAGVLAYLITSGELSPRKGNRVVTPQADAGSNQNASGLDDGDQRDVPRQPWVPLRALADRSGIYFGSAYNDFRIWSTSAAEQEAYNKLYAANANMITAENACKPAEIFASGPQAPNFEPCDRFLEWAKDNGMLVRFHVGAWGDWNPQWMLDLPAAEKRDALIANVRTTFRHFRNASHVIYWDVVNEVICDANPGRRDCDASVGRPEDLGFLRARQDAPRPPLWYPDVPDYVDLCFFIAREELGPNAILVLNDYGVESTEDPTDLNKAERMYDWVKAALLRGVPIDAIGFQLHISTFHDGSGLSIFRGWVDGVREMATAYALLGLEVHFTEVDIGCSYITTPCLPDLSEVVPVPGFPDIFGSSAQEAQKAVLYAKLLRMCLELEVCTAFQMWGFSDKYSWRVAGEGETSLLNHYAHIFDTELRPKASAYALLGVFSEYVASKGL